MGLGDGKLRNGDIDEGLIVIDELGYLNGAVDVEVLGAVEGQREGGTVGDANGVIEG